MPTVFSPGEPETRPLDPDAIVYTTGNKVAELLGIAAGEPVLAAADTASTGFYITGTDLREHGFESGDTILVFSDDDPLGTQFTITAPVVEDVSGTKYVKLPTTVAGYANYTTASSTEIQNLTIFTNGKSRGVTKNIVNDHIKRIQDRIDNLTHNAWRPYLVSAEYINFDTYKPYRRRYFTDYVGTAPLLFRNVQQILRIEIWQGDDYREIGSAEARLEIADYTALTGESLYLCPGGGGVAKLAVGTGTQQWDNRFDKVTTAQNLADLINKEDRGGYTAIPFSSDASPAGSTFTLRNGSIDTDVNVNNEFLASANADYGNGKLKVSSMRQAKGGESATIASTDNTALTITQTSNIVFENNYNVPSIGSATITITDTDGLAEYGLLENENGTLIYYTSRTDSLISGITELDGPALPTDEGNYSYTWTQRQFQSDIGAFSDAGGDQARLKDWWLDHEMGIIYFNNSYPYFEWNAVKVAYIYGERYVEKAIEEAATKLVASELLMADDRSVLIPEGGQNIDLGSKAQLWRREAMEIIGRYKEVVVFS